MVQKPIVSDVNTSIVLTIPISPTTTAPTMPSSPQQMYSILFELAKSNYELGKRNGFHICPRGWKYFSRTDSCYKVVLNIQIINFNILDFSQTNSF